MDSRQRERCDSMIIQPEWGTRNVNKYFYETEAQRIAALNEIFNLAEEQGISRRTLENAKKELGIRAKRINNSWYWELDKIKPE